MSLHWTILYTEDHLLLRKLPPDMHGPFSCRCQQVIRLTSSSSCTASKSRDISAACCFAAATALAEASLMAALSSPSLDRAACERIHPRCVMPPLRSLGVMRCPVPAQRGTTGLCNWSRLGICQDLWRSHGVLMQTCGAADGLTIWYPQDCPGAAACSDAARYIQQIVASYTSAAEDQSNP